jgi:hypothetical protein
MGGIKFFGCGNKEIDEIFPNGEQYKLMEKMTGRRFDRRIKNTIKRDLGHPPGAMFADWVNTSFVVKEACPECYGENCDEEAWEAAPCKELVFKNGRLTATYILEDVH